MNQPRDLLHVTEAKQQPPVVLLARQVEMAIERPPVPDSVIFCIVSLCTYTGHATVNAHGEAGR